jgi:hypothetical protein
MNFLNICKVSAIIEFEIKTEELLNVPDLGIPMVTDEWAKATSAATRMLTEVKIHDVAETLSAGDLPVTAPPFQDPGGWAPHTTRRSTTRGS